MKRLTIIMAALVLSACGGGGGDDTSRYAGEQKLVKEAAPVLISTETYTFDTRVLGDTLVKKGLVQLYSSWSHTRKNAYLVEDEHDLAVFNQTVMEHERAALEDLATYTYFLIRGPHCPNHYEVANSGYQPAGYTITLKLFALTNGVCPAVMVDEYTVFRAKKQE